MNLDNDRYFRPLSQTALRIAAGLTYFSHGAQKIFGWFGGFDGEGGTAELLSSFGAAGLLEAIAGPCIMVGLLTRPLAFLASGQMAVAYFWMHWGMSGKPGWWQNGGEIAAVYSFVWLLFAAWGAGPFSLDAWLQKQRSAA